MTATDERVTVLRIGRYDTNGKLVLGGLVATVVGAVLPWTSAFGVTVTGLQTGGILTLTAVTVAAWLLYVDGWSERATRWSAILGGGVVSVATLHYSGGAAIGLYLTAAGGAAMAYGGYQRLQQSH